MNDDQKEQIVRFIAARTALPQEQIIKKMESGAAFTVDRDHPAGYWARE